MTVEPAAFIPDAKHPTCYQMPHLTLVIAAIALLMYRSTAEAAHPDALEHVLQAKVFELSEELGDTSEYGQDVASSLKAHACRMKTEARIGAVSMRRVSVLAVWREALDAWEDLELDFVMLQSGGGTMWSHQKSRNNLAIEEFLDEIADRLPLEEVDLPPTVDRELAVLLKDAKTRLAKATKDDLGNDPSMAAVVKKRSAALGERMEHVHQRLRECFRLSGDAKTTAALLKYCKDCAGTWSSMNSLHEEP